VLTAVEALLVSLYGFRPSTDLSAVRELSHDTFLPPSSPLQTDASQLKNEGIVDRGTCLTNRDDSFDKDLLKQSDTAMPTSSTSASLDRQPSNCSSSSSVADDWIVNQIPEEFHSSFPLLDDGMTQSCSQTEETDSAKNSPHRHPHIEELAADTSKDQISAQDWSRGTAVTDPSSGEPLQPVIIHQPLKHDHSDSGQHDKTLSSSSKKMLNAITEKRAALTAYDMISNRAMRAPLSPVALFEKEARAEVLREKPTASLQDISIAVHERWKNLREEDRKK